MGMSHKQDPKRTEAAKRKTLDRRSQRELKVIFSATEVSHLRTLQHRQEERRAS